MRVQITDDWVEGPGRSSVHDLDELVMNLSASDAWQHGCNELDMRQELASRGWYEGTCDFGHYLVLNLERMQLEYRDPAMGDDAND